MKWKLLLCVAALAVAGCASEEQSPYVGYGDFGFQVDLVPTPVQGLTEADVDNMLGSTAAAPSSGYSQHN